MSKVESIIDLLHEDSEVLALHSESRERNSNEEGIAFVRTTIYDIVPMQGKYSSKDLNKFMDERIGRRKPTVEYPFAQDQSFMEFGSLYISEKIKEHSRLIKNELWINVYPSEMIYIDLENGKLHLRHKISNKELNIYERIEKGDTKEAIKQDMKRK